MVWKAVAVVWSHGPWVLAVSDTTSRRSRSGRDNAEELAGSAWWWGKAKATLPGVGSRVPEQWRGQPLAAPTCPHGCHGSGPTWELATHPGSGSHARSGAGQSRGLRSPTCYTSGENSWNSNLQDFWLSLDLLLGLFSSSLWGWGFWPLGRRAVTNSFPPGVHHHCWWCHGVQAVRHGRGPRNTPLPMFAQERHLLVCQTSRGQGSHRPRRPHLARLEGLIPGKVGWRRGGGGGGVEVGGRSRYGPGVVIADKKKRTWCHTGWRCALLLAGRNSNRYSSSYGWRYNHRDCRSPEEAVRSLMRTAVCGEWRA